MGWEQRGSRLYYYRKARRGGRVVSEYVGRGEVAELIALIDRDERASRGEKRAEKRAEREALDGLDAAAERAFTELRALAGAALVAAGYHEHRGLWRKSRGKEPTDARNEVRNRPSGEPGGDEGVLGTGLRG